MGEITTGATNDIEKATEVARRMVCKYGMSERLGPLTYGREEEQIFLGKEITTQKDYSERTAQEIDAEIRLLVEQGVSRSREIVLKHREELEKLAQALLEKETLSAEEVAEIAGVRKKTGQSQSSGGESHEEVDPRQESFTF